MGFAGPRMGTLGVVLLGIIVLSGPACPGFSQTVAPAGAMHVALGPLKHRIQTGETLTMLSKRYGVSIAAILRANPGLQPDRLRRGREVLIPLGRSSHLPPLPGIEPAGDPVLAPGAGAVEVQAGHTPPPLVSHDLSDTPAKAATVATAVPSETRGPVMQTTASALPVPAPVAEREGTREAKATSPTPPALAAAPSLQDGPTPPVAAPAIAVPTPPAIDVATPPAPALSAPPAVATMAAPTPAMPPVAPAWRSLGLSTGQLLVVVGLLVGGLFALDCFMHGLAVNLLAWCVMLWGRRFRVGDLIRLSGTTGQVKSMGLCSATVRTVDGERWRVPNIRLLREAWRVLPQNG